MKNKEKENPNKGIDRWTSNGYGMTIDKTSIKKPKEKETKEK